MVQVHSFRHKLFIFAWIFIFALVLGSLGIRGTWATYSSQEVSGKNSLRGGSIELSVSSIESDIVDPGLVYGFKVKNDGHNPLRYQMILDGEEDDFCGLLHLSAQRGETLAYSGELSSFSYTFMEALDPDESDSWKFLITLFEDASIPENTPYCEITLRLEAWQDRLLSLGMGWYDEREIVFPPLVFESSDSEKEEIPSPPDNDAELIGGNISQQGAVIESAADHLSITEVDAVGLTEELGTTVQDAEVLLVE